MQFEVKAFFALCELLGGVPVQLVLGWAELWLSMATMFMSGILVMLTSTTWGTWNTWNILNKNKRWYCFWIYFTRSFKYKLVLIM